MHIAQITDLHVGGDDVAAYYRLDTRQALRQSIDQINALSLPVDVCLVTGDIVENGTRAEYAIAREELTRLRAPWYAIPGNHDHHDNFRAEFAGTQTPLGDDDFVQYAVDDFPLRIIALDSVIPRRTGGELCARRLAWLEKTLSAAPAHPTLIMLHHPPFATRQPAVDTVCLDRQDEFAEIMGRHPQVEAIISGHVHRAIHTRIAQAAASSCPSTAHQMALALNERDPMAFTHEPPRVSIASLGRTGDLDHPYGANRKLCRSVFVSLNPSLPPAKWFRVDGENLILSVYAQPGAKHTEIQGLHGDAMKIRVAAPPLEGRANDEIRRFLAELLGLPLRDVALVSGEKSRSKRFAIRGGRVEMLGNLVTNHLAKP